MSVIQSALLHVGFINNKQVKTGKALTSNTIVIKKLYQRDYVRLGLVSEVSGTTFYAQFHL